MAAALDTLYEWSEMHPAVFPPAAARDAWEELWWQFGKDLLHIDSELLLVAREDNPTFDRIKFICNATRDDGHTWLQLPRTFQVLEPAGYFMTEIWDRRVEQVNRNCWKQASHTPEPRPGRAGGMAAALEEADADAAAQASRATSKGERRAAKAGGKGKNGGPGAGPPVVHDVVDDGRAAGTPPLLYGTRLHKPKSREFDTNTPATIRRRNCASLLVAGVVATTLPARAFTRPLAGGTRSTGASSSCPLGTTDSSLARS